MQTRPPSRGIIGHVIMEKVKNANEGVDTAAGQDDVWTLDLFSVLKRRVSCRVLAWD